MSDEQTQIDPITVECAVCGKVGFPADDCKQCEGHAGIQKRQFTLSELRTMTEDQRRVALGNDTRPSGSSPRRVDVPGSE